MMASAMVYAQGTFHPGQIWKYNRVIHINAHGGGVMEYNGTYYWFGEHKADTTSSAYVGVTCYSSKNLTDWEYEGVALEVVDDLLLCTTHKLGMFYTSKWLEKISRRIFCDTQKLRVIRISGSTIKVLLEPRHRIHLQTLAAFTLQLQS